MRRTPPENRSAPEKRDTRLASTKQWSTASVAADSDVAMVNWTERTEQAAEDLACRLRAERETTLMAQVCGCSLLPAAWVLVADFCTQIPPTGLSTAPAGGLFDWDAPHPAASPSRGVPSVTTQDVLSVTAKKLAEPLSPRQQVKGSACTTAQQLAPQRSSCPQ